MKSSSKIYRDGLAKGREESAETIRKLNADLVSALDLVARVRQAIGDHGQRMQPELLDYCRELAGCAGTTEKLKAALDKALAENLANRVTLKTVQAR